MAGFAKLFSSIVTSSIWLLDDSTLRVWIAMLATCDRYGIVEGSIPGFANLARVSVDDMEKAVATLSAPDPYSRSPENEGRRIETIPGGWRILNYEDYRSKPQGDSGSRAPYYREYRRKKREDMQHEDVACNNATLHNVATASASGIGIDLLRSGSSSSGDLETDQGASLPGIEPPNAATSPKGIASEYLANLNAVHSRKFNTNSPDSSLVSAVAKRLHDGYRRNHIVAIPILTHALGVDARKYSAGVFLRDGSHPRTSNGRTTGGYDWLAETFGKIDTIKLSREEAEIADRFGVLQFLVKLGVQLRKERP